MKKYVLLLCLFGFLSCTIENDEESAPTSEVQLLKSVFLNNELLFSFDYFTDRRIQTQITFANEGISSFTSFEYANDTVYKNTSGFFTYKSKSYLENQNSIRLLELDEDDNLLFSHLSIYSSNDCGLSKIETYTQFNDLHTVTDFEYIDSNCSYNSRKELFNGVLKNNFSITNDDQNNYQSSLSPWPSFSKKHNILEYRQWDANDDLILNQSYNSVYIYNELGYPIQETRTTLEGAVKVYTYEYY